MKPCLRVYKQVTLSGGREDALWDTHCHTQSQPGGEGQLEKGRNLTGVGETHERATYMCKYDQNTYAHIGKCHNETHYHV